jgi:hypothetical protein
MVQRSGEAHDWTSPGIGTWQDDIGIHRLSGQTGPAEPSLPRIHTYDDAARRSIHTQPPLQQGHVPFSSSGPRHVIDRCNKIQ